MMQYFKEALLTTACLGVTLSAFAASPTLPEPFSYYADGHDIKTVLKSFARKQDLRADFEEGIAGKVSGRFRGIDPEEFLDAMGEAYGIGYYVLSNKIHFYITENLQKEFMTVPGASSRELVESLKVSGFIAEELPVEINQEGNMLTLVGPQAYLDAIKTAAQAYQAVQTEKIVMKVFPLKYAWADDITLSNMDQTITVPGIASILRGMVMGQTVSGNTVSHTRTSAKSVESLGGEGLSKQSTYKGGKQTAKQSALTETIPMGKGSISIMADPRVNAVLVSDAAFRMPYYEEVIRDLDKSVELVEIHAAIVDIDTNASRELGVNLTGKTGSGNWQGGGSMGAGNTGAFDGNGLPSIPSQMGSAGAILSTIYTHGSDFFMARINALESKNAARMLGRPSVLTVDNVQAVLENTTTYYIPLRGTEAVDLYKVESGTVLRVTPHIIRENGKTSIKLAVSVQDDQNDSGAGYQNIGGESSDSVTVSPIKQTKINTQAIVDVGQSLLIGGYYYEQKGEGDEGVPILKDIPILGHLFKSTNRSSRRMERLILITPRILRPDADNVPARVNDPEFVRSATGAGYEFEAQTLEAAP